MRAISASSRSWQLAALAAVLSLGAVSGNAEATCWNKGCDGKAVVGSGCRDGTQFTARAATIKTSSGSVVGHVSLVYSGTCGAAWTSVTSAIGTVYHLESETSRRNGPLSDPSTVWFDGWGECFGCSSKLSTMAGDAGSNLLAQGTGVITQKVVFFGRTFYPTYQASTAWF